MSGERGVVCNEGAGILGCWACIGIAGLMITQMNEREAIVFETREAMTGRPAEFVPRRGSTH